MMRQKQAWISGPQKATLEEGSGQNFEDDDPVTVTSKSRMVKPPHRIDLLPDSGRSSDIESSPL